LFDRWYVTKRLILEYILKIVRADNLQQ